ncbi:MAG TPA: hypothetical protein VM901_01965 [Bdellovibrionota bacterium]|nr:hypothetical protein [Bdellovibrionota bacterium]
MGKCLVWLLCALAVDHAFAATPLLDASKSCLTFIEYLQRFEEARDTAALHGTSMQTFDELLRTSHLPPDKDGRLYFMPNPHGAELARALREGRLDPESYRKSMEHRKYSHYDLLKAFKVADIYAGNLAIKYFVAARLNLNPRSSEAARADGAVLEQAPENIPGSLSHKEKSQLISEALQISGIILGFDEASMREYPFKTASDFTNLGWDEGLGFDAPGGLHLRHLAAVWTHTPEQKRTVEDKLRARDLYVPVYLLPPATPKR